MSPEKLCETHGEDTVPLDGKKHRKSLFADLGLIRSISMEKFKMQKSANRVRQGWGRLVVSTAEVEAKLLEGIQLEEMEERIKLLEEHRIENHGETSQKEQPSEEVKTKND